MKIKIYICITQDVNVEDGINELKVETKTSRKEADKWLKETREECADYMKQKDMEYESYGRNGFQYYESGYQCANHFSASVEVNEVEIKTK